MYLQLDTRFNPFTYDEMVKPLLYYKQAYDVAEAAYSDLAFQTEAWRNVANRDQSPQAFEMFQRYSGDLNKAVEDFSKGMNSKNRRALLVLKRRYASDIQPIADAYKRRSALAEEQRKAELSNPTMLWEKRAGDMSLDDFINNPNADYGQQYSGALITQQVANAAANIAKEARDSEEGKRKLRKLLPYQYEMVQQSGFSREAVMKAIMNSPDADNILTGLVDSAINTSGVLNWGDQNTISRAYDYARQGLYNAIGQTSYQMVTDQAGLTQLQYDLQDRNARRSEARAAARKQKEAEEKGRARQLRMYRNNTGRLFSESEVANANKDTLAELDKWKDKGYLNSKGQLTNKGWNAMKNQLLYEASGVEANSNSPYAKARSYAGRDKEFLTWATQKGVKYTAPTKVQNWDANGRVFFTYSDPTLQGYGNMTNYYNKTRQTAASGELVTGLANIKVIRNRVSSSETGQNNLVNLITSTNSPIYGAGALQEDGKIKQGKKFSAEEFRKLVKDNPIVHLMNNPVGNQQLVELSNGQRFFIPKSVFGESLVDPLHERGDLDIANAIIRTSQEGSDDAIMASANASAYLSSILDTTGGDEINYHGSITEEELYQ